MRTRDKPSEPKSESSKPVRRGRPPLDPEVRRKRILEVASEMFTTNGYLDTTVEAVSKAAGVTKRTIYELVGDKTDLFRAVVNHRNAGIGDIRLDLPVSGESLRNNLIKLAQDLLDYALSEDTLAVERMIMIEHTRFPELIGEINEANRQGLNKTISVVFDKLSAMGMISNVSSFDSTELFFDVVVGNRGFRKILGYEDDPPTSAEIEERVDVFLQGYVMRHRTAEF